jgi:hypothetical protein
MRWAGHVARMEEERSVYRVLVGKPEGKRPLGRPRRRWENKIRTNGNKFLSHTAVYITAVSSGNLFPRAGLDRCGKFLLTGIRSPDRPVRSQSLYRPSYPAPLCCMELINQRGYSVFMIVSYSILTQPPVQWVPGLSRG